MTDIPHYTVWRRNDGYVAASNRSYPMTAKQLGWTDTSGNIHSFEILLVTTDWLEAKALIEKERAK